MSEDPFELEALGGYLAMMGEEGERVYEYMGCKIALKSEQSRGADGSPGRWIPAATVTVSRGGTLTDHPLSWHKALADTVEEADRFALQAALRWIHEHV